MYTIIQEKLKRINSRLSPMVNASIFGSLLIILSFLLGLNFSILDNKNVEIISSSSSNLETKLKTDIVNYDKQSVGRIYASNKGKKYYIEGICDGNISLKNKVFYKDEDSAIKGGKAKATGCN